MRACGRLNKVRLWDRATAELIHTFRAHHGDVNAVCCVRAAVDSHAGGGFVTAGSDGSARIWDLETGKWTEVLLNRPYHSDAPPSNGCTTPLNPDRSNAMRRLMRSVVFGCGKTYGSERWAARAEVGARAARFAWRRQRCAGGWRERGSDLLRCRLRWTPNRDWPDGWHHPTL